MYSVLVFVGLTTMPTSTAGGHSPATCWHHHQRRPKDWVSPRFVDSFRNHCARSWFWLSVNYGIVTLFWLWTMPVLSVILLWGCKDPEAKLYVWVFFDFNVLSSPSINFLLASSERNLLDFQFYRQFLLASSSMSGELDCFHLFQVRWRDTYMWQLDSANKCFLSK